MITKEEARNIAIEYLERKRREYVEIAPLEKVTFTRKEKILYGEAAGKELDTYTVHYTVEWGLEYKSLFIIINAENGIPLCTIGPTSWIEEFEKD